VAKLHFVHLVVRESREARAAGEIRAQ